MGACHVPSSIFSDEHPPPPADPVSFHTCAPPPPPLYTTTVAFSHKPHQAQQLQLMAPSFGRSISMSFPLSPSSKRAAAASYHVRSVSLPCRSHPILSHLQAQIRAVRSWLVNDDDQLGLTHLHALHAALAELLLLPEARSALRSGSATAARLLDAFLVLADAHGAFQEAALELRAHASEAQSALRRRDAARLASAVRSQRGAEKDMARLASSLRSAASCRPSWSVLPSAATSAAEVEMSGVLAEAVSAAASASAAVFSAVESMSAAATTMATSSSSKKKTTTSLMSLVVKKRKGGGFSDETEAVEKLEEVEGCMVKMESGIEMVFRSILHTRVALLNIHCSC